MNVVWLILDSVSFAATPFAEDGPNTMPKLSSLVEERDGTVFTRAYAPGITSPSSHGSVFTGELPTTTGMHEANPRFETDHQTITQVLNNTHRTFMVSSNRFLFNGLEKDFDDYTNVLYPTPMFEEAAGYPDFVKYADPRVDSYEPSRLRRYQKFVLSNGKPVRSLVNGLQFKLGDRSEEHRYVERTNRHIRNYVGSTDGNYFLAVNYMDAHAPFDATDEAITKWGRGQTREELPIGESGTELNGRLRQGEEGAEEDAERMYDLYKASIWDMDRELGPLIEELLQEETLVIVTADHGNWFRRREELERQRLHVPLIVFSPNMGGNVVDHTVNIRSLPRTTVEAVHGDDGGFKGTDLSTVADDQLSITEGFYNPVSGPSPVNIHGNDKDEFLYHAAIIEDDTEVRIVDEEIEIIQGSETKTEELQETAEELRSRTHNYGSDETIEYDEATEQRLKDLGYT